MAQMRAEYEQLRAKWVETFKKAESLGYANEALVCHYLVQSADHTSHALRTRANDPESAKDAAEYAASLRAHAAAYRGWGTVASVCAACGLTITIVLRWFWDLCKAIPTAFDTVGHVGAQVNLAPLIRFLLTGGV